MFTLQPLFLSDTHSHAQQTLQSLSLSSHLPQARVGIIQIPTDPKTFVTVKIYLVYSNKQSPRYLLIINVNVEMPSY